MGFLMYGSMEATKPMEAYRKQAGAENSVVMEQLDADVRFHALLV
jgi:hypothetical protein